MNIFLDIKWDITFILKCWIDNQIVLMLLFVNFLESTNQLQGKEHGSLLFNSKVLRVLTSAGPA